jgi:hypothetical protein
MQSADRSLTRAIPLPEGGIILHRQTPDSSQHMVALVLIKVSLSAFTIPRETS